MPTVDAAPQNTEWLDTFGQCDALLTYSDWAVDVLKKQGGHHMKVHGSAPASAQEDFKILDKSECRKALGISDDAKIVGTVMRNQRRKLFPDLFESFSKYLKKSGDTNAYLYCHTSYPDNGWPLAELIVQHGIASRTLLTYHCEACGSVFASFFSNPIRNCSKCGNFSAKSSSVNHGIDVPTLANVYNCMDLYIQCANSEGFGLPTIEAAACGVPVMATDYSAMSSEVRKVGGIMIPPLNTYKEMETGCRRACPDTDFIAEKIGEVLSQPEAKRRSMGFKTRQLFEENFSWDKTAKVWEGVIDSLKDTPSQLHWDSPSRASQPIPPDKIPEFQNNKQFLDWMFANYLRMPEKIGTHPANCLLRDFNNGMFRNNPGGFFYSESSAIAKTEYRPLNKDNVIQMIHGKLMEKNFWEDVRTGKVVLEKEPWL
jgi:glycosyltransferase involved in cell wall biosynthesis